MPMGLDMGPFEFEALDRAALIISRLLVKTNFKIKKDCHEESSQNLPMVSIEKDVFSILVNGTFQLQIWRSFLMTGHWGYY